MCRFKPRFVWPNEIRPQLLACICVREKRVARSLPGRSLWEGDSTDEVSTAWSSFFPCWRRRTLGLSGRRAARGRAVPTHTSSLVDKRAGRCTVHVGANRMSLPKVVKSPRSVFSPSTTPGVRGSARRRTAEHKQSTNRSRLTLAESTGAWYFQPPYRPWRGLGGSRLKLTWLVPSQAAWADCSTPWPRFGPGWPRHGSLCGARVRGLGRAR